MENRAGFTSSTKLSRYGEAKNSRIILAYDRWKSKSTPPKRFLSETLKLLLELEECLAGIKFGVPTIATLGLWSLAEVLKVLKGKTYLLADMKIADIGYISKTIVDLVAETGFDGVIVHAIIGFKKGLEEIVREARERDLEVYALVAMSHPGGEEVLNKNFNELVDLALKSNVHGLVVPATMPKYIVKAREKTLDKTIISPGVGVQGAPPGSAVSRGADFEIIGRAILSSEKPKSKIIELARVLNW